MFKEKNGKYPYHDYVVMIFILFEALAIGLILAFNGRLFSFARMVGITILIILASVVIGVDAYEHQGKK